MSQSILQNGYAIIMANTADLDKYLLAKDQLLNRIAQLQQTKIKERDEAIEARQNQINIIDSYVDKLFSNDSSQEEIDQ